MRPRTTASPGATVCLIILTILAVAAGCAPGTSARSQSSRAASFADLAILPTLEFANAPQVILAAARDFRDLCLEAEADRVLGRMDRDSGTWLEFALVTDGVFYVLPALGYHTPADRLDGERLKVPSAESYYQLQRRGVPEYRYRSYFVE